MAQVKTVLGKVGFTPKGAWTAEKTYDRLDVVTHEGSSFLSLVAGNTAETTDTAKWQQIAAKGDAGVKGDTGDTGEQGEKGDAFTYDDFTEEQIAALKQPALDAAEVAEEAAAEALNVPKIEDGYFWVWSTETHAYVKTSSQATGQSPKIVDGEWWVYDDATQQYINTHVSASADYELTKEKVEAVFTGDITTHNHSTQLTSTLANYVVKETGKGLSANDYTDEEKEKLAGLENYDDTAVKALITAEAERATGVEADKVDKVSGKGLSTNDYTDADKAKLAKLNIVPTLTAEPTEDTLTFTDDDGTHTFLVGDLARVYEEDDYVFYQLYDITDENKATWKKAGSGGGTIEPETLKLTLTSNQAQPDASLNGAVVHVKYGDNDTELTWQGETLTTTIPMNMTYTIEFPAVEGYATPLAQEYIAIMSNTRQATAAYNTTVMTLTLDSNQTDKTDLAGATLTLSGSIEKVLTYSEDNAGVFTQKVPLGEEVTITPSAITGYQTPAAVVKTPDTATDSATLTHNTELVTVTVTADDSASCSGQVVTVGSAEYTYSAPFSVKIAYDTEYSVSVNAKSGYNAPASVSYTAAQATRAITMTYEAIKANYITINQTITDPATMITGDVNGEVIQWIRNNSHRVLAKYTATGTMTYCRLLDTDGTKYYDGTTATLTGTEGDVFMKLPHFYYKAEETETDKWKIGFAYEQIDSTWKEWAGTDLIGVYEAYNASSKIYSRSGQASTGSVSQANFKTYARARGTGFSIVKWKHHCMMAFLFYAQYGHMNCQAKIGAGTNAYTKETGGTNSLGMEDTVAGGNGDSGSINFWGLENWWGNKYEWVDNVVVNPVSANGVWRITEDDNTTRDIQGVTGSGYITKAYIGDRLDLVPTAYSGSDTTGYCDYGYAHTSSTARVVRRSYYYSDTNGGVACAYAAVDSSYTDTSYGSRLAFSGSLYEAESVSAYKALSAIG